MDEGSYYHRPEDGDDWNAIPGRKRCGDRMYRKNDPYGELDPYSGFEVIGIDSIVVDGQKRKAITWNNGNTWVVGLGEINEYPLAQFYMDYTTCITPPFYLLYQKVNGEYSYEVLAEHDFTPDPCVSGIVENKSSSLRIAHTSDAPDCDLAGHRLSIGRAHRDDRPLGVVRLLGRRGGRSNDSHRHPFARSVYRHPIERPGRTHCTESDDTVN